MADTSSPRQDLPMAPAGCTLDDGGLAEQLERYRRLAATAVSVEQGGLELMVRFNADVDLDLVHETVAIERQCCSFFKLAYDPSGRRLTIAVADPDRIGALTALRAGLRS